MSIQRDYDLKQLMYEGDEDFVYKAVQRDNNQSVIIKTPKISEPSYATISQYRREYEFCKLFQDTTFRCELVESENFIALVICHVDSILFRDYITQAPFDLLQRVEIAIQIAKKIAEIHNKNIVYKNINPHSILWDESQKKVDFFDFSIATILPVEEQSFISSNQIEGNIAYISPEQTGRINRALDYRSDFYSLGVLLYELFTGELPFIKSQSIEYVHAHIAQIATDVHEINQDVPVEISKIISKLMQKIADERYQDITSVLSDLHLCLEAFKSNEVTVNLEVAKNDIANVFQIPQKLYGRYEEYQRLKKSFDSVCEGKKELVLISGFSGTGKTALVQELFRPITEKRGNYINGKFDQYQRDVPYYAWKKVFESFLQLLLAQEKTILDKWRNLISSGLGELAPVLIELVADFELVLGQYKELEQLPSDQALNRFHYAVGEFIKVISSAENPLCIFIDDWQWADAPSINLLKYLVNRFDIKHMLIIAAWRDNEVDNTHLFSLALDDFNKLEIALNKIHIDNLTKIHIRELVDESLHTSRNTDELVKLIYQKTLGNAFFVKQFLKTLYRESLLFFDEEKYLWKWDIDKIHSKNISNNVVELMTETISTIEPEAQYALRIAACIGNKFSISTLALILKKSIEATYSQIQPALKQGILLPIKNIKNNSSKSDDKYQFVHDRVQQAAYGLVEETKQIQTHYEIAKIYLEQSSTDEYIFELINHINLASTLFIKHQEEELLVKYNMLAGLKAKQGNAYMPAYNYYLLAMKYITEQDWKKHTKQLTKDYLSAAETAFLVNQYDSMETLLSQYLSHNADPMIQVDAYEIRLKAYIKQNRLQDAIDIGLSALELLGLKLSAQPSQLSVIWNMLLTQRTLKGKSFNELLNLPELKDHKKLKIMNVLGQIIPPAYWASPNLLAVVVFYMVRSGVKDGYFPHAGYAFSWWGIIQGSLLGNLKEGFEFGQFGESIARKNHLNLEQPVFFRGWITHHMQKPLSETIDMLEEAYQLSMEKGNFEYASYALNNNMQARFHIAQPLPGLLHKMSSAHNDLEIFNLGSSLFWHDIWWQTAINFNDVDANQYELSGLAYNELERLPEHEKANDLSTLFLAYTAKLLLSTFFGNDEKAQEFATKARACSAAAAGMYALVLFTFYESLSIIKQLEKVSGFGARKLQSQLKKNIKALSKWAKFSPENHQHRLWLVQAEYYRFQKKPIEAEKHYELAIEQSQKNNFTHESALCYEYNALFYANKKQNKFMQIMYKHAIELYRQWGAEAKVQQLLEKHQFLNDATSSLHNASKELDLQTLMNCYQSISSSVTFEGLIQSLLIHLIKNSGAQRALFLLNRHGELYVEGEATIDNKKESFKLESIKIKEFDLLPPSIVNYVNNSLKDVVLNDARTPSNFSNDLYIRKHKPISILCVPIVKQGILSGIVYLENNLSADVFSLKHLEFLKLVMAQVAISIENTAMYERLEDKVVERTKELDSANYELMQVQERLKQLAKTDALTQLANRHYFNEFATINFNHCVRQKQMISILMSDIDSFKEYNDNYGHIKGDECLKMIAEQFEKVFNRKSDLIARYGGEEFVVVLPNTHQEEAQKMAENLRKNIQEKRIEHNGNTDYGVVTISIGVVSQYPTHEDTLEGLLEKADEALYRAKQLGKNRVERYDA